MSLPKQASYVVVGAGIHGLSTAYHLARELRSRGAGSGADVVVLDKSKPGAGASGIACGVVRNNYFQPAMSELMQACVEVWESDPDAYHYNAVGYIALGARCRSRPDRDLRAAGADRATAPSSSRRGRGRRAHEGALPRLAGAGRHGLPARAPGRLRVQLESVLGLADKCRREGVRSSSGVEVTGFESRDDDSIAAVETSRAASTSASRSSSPRPVGRSFWSLLGLPDTIDITTPSGDVVRDRPMWTYWNLQEGEITVDPLMFATADGGAPPVIHLDTDAPLYTDDGELVTDELWGIYFKRDRHGVQGGASPLTVDGDVELDPYPRPRTSTLVPGHVVRRALALDERFEGCRAVQEARSGGVGAFTADNFPVFDYVRPNLYGVFDSNHGYKMIGVGREVASVLLGDHSRAPLPVPLRALRDRRPPPVSSSPYPWS
jgi:glycine/D-amino acid oxidase-like deaminating enzyme